MNKFTSLTRPERGHVHNPNDSQNAHFTVPVSAWGQLARYEKKESVGEVVQLTGQFAAVGVLSSSVHDAQPVCSDWDLRNEASFALIRQTEPLGSDGPEDVWLYNRYISN